MDLIWELDRMIQGDPKGDKFQKLNIYLVGLALAGSFMHPFSLRDSVLMFIPL